MRIHAGQYRGRVLNAPKNNNIRPTSDKIRGAVFNALGSRGLVQGSFVLDGFCGTGALGLEALSQGASHAVFIDKSRESLALCRQNVSALGAEQNAELLLKDSTKLPPKPDHIIARDLIFLDPPYDKDMIAPSIQAIINQGWSADRACFMIECEKRFSPDLAAINACLTGAANFTCNFEKIYGDTKIMFIAYTKTPE